MNIMVAKSNGELYGNYKTDVIPSVGDIVSMHGISHKITQVEHAVMTDSYGMSELCYIKVYTQK